MKRQAGKRVLSLLLALVMLLGLLPTSALAQDLADRHSAAAAEDLLRQMGLRVQEDGNSQQTNHVYTIHGRSYKVIFNDYIACYVDMETGGYTILPAAEPLPEDAPTGTAVFTIDGTDYVFGGNYPEMNAELMPARVRGDMAVTNWMLGDFFISQYQAITLDQGHDNSYAVKVAYLAEYLGDAAVTPEISVRTILPTRLGEGADGTLFTETGLFLAGPTVLDEVPKEMAMSASGEGPRTFFVLDGAEGLPHPERMALGERDELVAGNYPLGLYQDETASGVLANAAAFDFPAAVLTIPVDDITAKTNQYGALVNYGFYNLAAAELALTVDEALTALEEGLIDTGLAALTGDAGEMGSEFITLTDPTYQKPEEERLTTMTGAAADTVLSFEMHEAVTMKDIRCQKPGDSESTPVSLEDNRLILPAGSTISFALELAEPERLRAEIVLYEYTEEGTQTAIIPDGDGRYTLTMPLEGGSVASFVQAAPGHVLLDLSGAYPAVVDSITPSRYAAAYGETVHMRLTADQPFFLNGDTGNNFDPPGIYYYLDGDDRQPVSVPLESGSREQGPDGVVEFSFVVPSVPGMESLGINVNSDNAGDYLHVSTKVAPRNAVPGGDLSINAPRINGIVRAKEGDTVTIEAPELADGFSPDSTTLAVYDLSNGYPITMTCGSITEPLSITVAAMAGNSASFTMPNADVEVRLAGAQYHRVSAKVDYQTAEGDPYNPADMNGAFSTTVGVTFLPESPTAGQEVTVRLDYNYVPDGSGATYNPFYSVFDGGATPIVSGVSNIFTKSSGREYTFIMPDHDVELTVTLKHLLTTEMEDAAENRNIRTLSTRPLVEGDAIRAGVWAWEEYTTQAVRPEPAQDGTSAQIPAGATVEYYAYEPDYHDDWHLTKVYLAKAETPELPLEGPEYQLEPGYQADGGYRTFTMPDFDCVLVALGEEGQPIKVEAYYYAPGETLEDARRAEHLDNMVRVYGNEPGWGFTSEDVTITSAKAGQAVYVDVLTYRGYSVDKIVLHRDGREPEIIDPWQRVPRPETPGREPDFIMDDRGVTIQVVYKAGAALTMRFDVPEGSEELKLTYPKEPLNVNTIYDSSGQVTGYRTGSWVQMENILTPTARYTLDGSYTIDGVTVTVTPDWVSGGASSTQGSYTLDFYWPADLGLDHPTTVIPIRKEVGAFSNTVLFQSTVNHTNPEKFQTVTVKGLGLDSIDKEAVYLLTYSTNIPAIAGYGIKYDFTTPVGRYKVDPSAVAINENGALVIDLKQAGALGPNELGGGAFPGFSMPTLNISGTTEMQDRAFQWTWGLEMTGKKVIQKRTSFEIEDFPIVEQFHLYDSEINQADIQYYLSIVRGSGDRYQLRSGRFESDVQAGEWETTVLSLYNQRGFFKQDDGSISAAPNTAWEIGFNGSMTLSNSGQNGSLTFRQDENGVLVTAYNLTLKALGVPLFVPGPGNDANKTLLMRLENGTRYDLTATADGSGTAKPLSFVSRGVPEIELLGWTGFTAGVDAITFTNKTIDVTGHLWLQWPFNEELFGGMDLKQLQLKINSGQDVLPAFGGIHAEGSFQMPELLVLEAGGKAIVNTFKHHYEFEAAAEVGPVSFGGGLKLIKSERLGLLVPDSFEVDFNLGDVGVPLVPPNIMAYITGVTGGYQNLAETLDWDPIHGKTALPDLRIIFGGHFKLLNVMSLDVKFNGGSYDVEGTVSGSIEIGGHGIDFFDYFTLWLGLRNVEGVPLGGGSQAKYARLRAGVTTEIGLKLSTSKLEDIVKGSTKFGVYIEFNNPVSVIADSIYAFLASMKDPKSGETMTLQEFTRAIDLTYVAFGSGDVTAQFPKIGPFGPIRLGGVHVDYDVGLKVALDKNYSLAGAGYVRLVGTVKVLMFKGYVVVDLLNDTFDLGAGSPPPFKGYRSRSLSAGDGFRVLADTESDSGYAPMSLSQEQPGAAIYAGTDGSTFHYRFTLPDNGGAHLLAVRVLNHDYESTPPALKLYDPRGTEVTLNQWSWLNGSELALPQRDAEFVVNALYHDGTDNEEGNKGWLIAIPDQSEVLANASGEWTLSASREVAVQLLEQDPMPGIAGVEAPQTAAYALSGPLSLSADTVSASFENLRPDESYAYSLDLVLRDAPAGPALNTLQIALGDGELPDGDMSKHRMALDVNSNGSAQVTVPINAALLPDDLASGIYYPVITLYRVDDTDDTGAVMTTPLDTAAAHPAITVTNTLFDSLTVDGLAVQAGLNQSLDLTFDGVSGDPAYQVVKDAGWVVKGYQATLYGPGGIPVMRNTTGSDETPVPEPVTARLNLTYRNEDGALVLEGADTGHTLSLTGLTPDTYMVGVVPIFAMAPTMDLETQGAKTLSTAVEVKTAVPPPMWLEAAGGSLGYGENDTELFYAGPSFSLDIKTDRNADIIVRTLRGAHELKSTFGTSLNLSADEYFFNDDPSAVHGYETLTIVVVDRATGGVSSRLLTIVPDLTAPVLVLDQQEKLGTVGSAFTVSGRTRPGLTVQLLNAKEPVSTVADQEGRFTLNGTLSDDAADRQIIVETTGSSGLASYASVVLEEVAEGDLAALELTPNGTVVLTEGNTLALTVQGVRHDGSRVDLNAGVLTFQTTGAHSVDAAGILTVGKGTGTVTALLGSLSSNTLTVSGEAQIDPTPTPTPTPTPDPSGGGGGGGGTAAYQVKVAESAHGTVAVSPKTASQGSLVTITPAPDTGYVVDTVLVTDSNGDTVSVTARSGGTYAFTMPGRPVTVTVTFKPEAVTDTWINPFTDVAKGDWFYPYVEFVHQNGLFSGTSETTFSPHMTTTRAMLWTVLARLDGQDTGSGDSWYAKARTWAMEQGISDGSAPESLITREQVAAMLYRYIQSRGQDVTTQADLAKFADAPSVSSWSKEAMAWANAAGIITGKPGGLLDPQGQAARAEVAAMLTRLLELYENP